MARLKRTLEKNRGDRKAWTIAIQDQNGGAISLLDAVVRFVVKERVSNVWADALIALSTYEGGVVITDPSGGICVATIGSGEDSTAPAGVHLWEVEVIRRIASIKASGGDGTVAFAADGTMTFTDAAVAAAARVGYLVVCAGTVPANQKQVAITHTPRTDPALTEFQVRTDYTGFTAEAGQGFTLYSSDVKSPDNLYGDFEIFADLNNL